MPAVIHIDHPNDPRLAGFRDVRERDLVGRHGSFIAEGVVVLEKLISAGRHPIDAVLVAEKRVETLKPLFAGLSSQVKVYAANQAVMDTLVGFPIHRGVLALGRRREPQLDEVLAGLPERGLVVALVGIANHDNMGGLFRNAAAFGASAVLLDESCCDPLYRKAIRVSVGAALTLPFARAGSAGSLTDALQRRGFAVIGLSPRGEIELDDFTAPPRTAVMFGAEGAGLPEDVIAKTQSVRIEMPGGFDSLNVATSSGIVLRHVVASWRRTLR